MLVIIVFVFSDPTNKTLGNERIDSVTFNKGRSCTVSPFSMEMEPPTEAGNPVTSIPGLNNAHDTVKAVLGTTPIICIVAVVADGSVTVDAAAYHTKDDGLKVARGKPAELFLGDVMHVAEMLASRGNMLRTMEKAWADAAPTGCA
jgi:hypothetical protein